MYDIFFLSYDEPFADERYSHIVDVFPAKHIRGIKGIYQAHKKCADVAKTKMFWVIDADMEVADDFDFTYIPKLSQQRYIHLWMTINPINGLKYGYGGIKLFPKVVFENSYGVDMTTTLAPLVIHDEICGTTRFDFDEFHTWRAAFREAAKLTKFTDPESVSRLQTWKTKTDHPFSVISIDGASEGEKFSKSTDDIALINDFEWLEQKYKERYT